MVDKSMGAALRFFEKVGHRINNAVQRLGFAARFFVMILVYSGQSFRRFHLTIREIYFSGFQSLLIILVSGLFIGMVLGMQGYETLQRYGSSEALGVLVALSLSRELGPVVAALLDDGLARGYADAEIGPWLQERLRLIHASSLTALTDITPRPQVVYLDPMFPHKQKSALVKKEMRVFQSLVEIGRASCRERVSSPV